MRKKDDKVSVYRFPGNGDEEREQWLQSIPVSLRKSEITDESVVCSRHWPEDAEIKKVFGKKRPTNPPSRAHNNEVVLSRSQASTTRFVEGPTNDVKAF